MYGTYIVRRGAFSGVGLKMLRSAERGVDGAGFSLARLEYAPAEGDGGRAARPTPCRPSLPFGPGRSV